MSDVEGVTAEETTVADSVENQTQEKVEEPKQVEETPEADPEDAENSEGSQEEPEEVDYKAEYEKLKSEKEELETKTKRQTAANRATQERYEKALAKIKTLEDKAAEKAEIKEEDFESYEEYEAALRKHDIKEQLDNEKLEDAKSELDDAKAELLAEEKEQFETARTTFVEREEAFVKENPQYTENVKSFQSQLDFLPKDERGVIQDAGAQAGMSYILTESEIGPQLLNHLGENPEKVEALFGKPPAFIVHKIKQYEQELKAQQAQPPEPKHNPPPPSKLKGSASAKVSPDKLSDPEAFMKWRNSQKRK